MRKIILAAAISAALPFAASAATYTDDFDNGLDLAWSNSSGNWTTGNGAYYAQSPTNNPTTYSGLSYDFTDFSVTTNVAGLGDSGVYFRTDGTNQNGYLLVLGGQGYGLGVRGGGAGNSLYIHRIVNGAFSGALGLVSNVFTPGGSYAIRVDGIGSQFNIYVDNVLKTSLNDSTFGHGLVGLYDTQPGPGGSGTPSTFLDFSVTGTLVNGAVPEPATWAMMLTGFGLVGGALRQRKAKPHIV